MVHEAGCQRGFWQAREALHSVAGGSVVCPAAACAGSAGAQQARRQLLIMDEVDGMSGAAGAWPPSPLAAATASATLQHACMRLVPACWFGLPDTAQQQTRNRLSSPCLCLLLQAGTRSYRR